MAKSSANLTPSNVWTIGTAADCDIVVSQPFVSRHHCRLTRLDGTFTVEDLGSTNGTYVDGVRLIPRKAAAVGTTSTVTLGTELQMPWPTGEAALPPGTSQVVSIGRSPHSMIHIDLPIISMDHARIIVEDNKYILEDLNSRNGTAIDRVDNRIHRAELDPASQVYLGSYKIAARQLLSGHKVEIGDSAAEKVEFRGESMVVGRDPKCDLPLEYPMISWHHARFTRVPEGILVEDLGSRNGTFVLGTRVTAKVIAKPGHEIALGSFRFQLLEGGGLAQRAYHGNVTIEAEDVVVNSRDGRRLIEPVSLTIFPSELVAVMGGAGAGKTTLLKALNGYSRPAEGRVLFNGVSLYSYYDRFRQQMGYVPQDDIVHAQLTVGEALYYSARLRTDLSESEIETRIQKVLSDLRIEDKRHTVIGSAERKTLSGGQRKRINIGLELINDTPVLFLDEPTSGLSSYDAESLIDLLKELSRQGKTIITTIHQPSLKIYKQFDDLIMVNRDQGGKCGSMVYFGPAFPDSIQFFGSATVEAGSEAPAQIELSPDILLSSLPKLPSSEWRTRFAESRYHKEFVEARSGKFPSAPGDSSTEALPRTNRFDLTQWLALVRRNTILKMRDRTQSTILLLQAPLFAVLICMVYHPLSAQSGFDSLSPKLAGVHFLLVVAAIWFGCNNAARDIVGEWTVYKRERMVTLKLSAYVLSKLAVLTVLGLVQCVSLLGIVYLALGLKSNFGMDLLILLLAAVIGTGLGLAISAAASTTESAIALLPVVLLPVIALGGGMRPIYQIDPQFRWITSAIPSRWAFEANLLQEIAPDGWKKDGNAEARTPLPDLGDPWQATQFASHKSGAIPPLNGDVAELSIPKYLMEWKDQDNHSHVARGFEGEDSKLLEGPAGLPAAKSQLFRHSFATSLAVLVGMVAVLVSAVLLILRKRDSDPN